MSWFSHNSKSQAFKKEKKKSKKESSPAFAIRDEFPVFQQICTVVGWFLLELGVCHAFLEKLPATPCNINSEQQRWNEV